MNAGSEKFQREDHQLERGSRTGDRPRKWRNWFLPVLKVLYIFCRIHLVKQVDIYAEKTVRLQCHRRFSTVTGQMAVL